MRRGRKDEDDVTRRETDAPFWLFDFWVLSDRSEAGRGERGVDGCAGREVGDSTGREGSFLFGEHFGGSPSRSFRRVCFFTRLG